MPAINNATGTNHGAGSFPNARVAAAPTRMVCATSMTLKRAQISAEWPVKYSSTPLVDRGRGVVRGHGLPLHRAAP
jgi:hypothetical protein